MLTKMGSDSNFTEININIHRKYTCSQIQLITQKRYGGDFLKVSTIVDAMSVKMLISMAVQVVAAVHYNLQIPFSLVYSVKVYIQVRVLNCNQYLAVVSLITHTQASLIEGWQEPISSLVGWERLIVSSMDDLHLLLSRFLGNGLLGLELLFSLE